MPRIPMIRVRSNPYAHLDEEGRPAGAVMLDPVEHAPYGSGSEPRRFVGAAIDLENTKVFQKAAEDSAQSDLQETHWLFSDDVVELPLTQYYLAAIRTGELLAADDETADHAGIAFVKPEDALDKAKHAALDRWKAERPKRGLPDWAKPSAPTRPSIRPPTVRSEVK